MASAYTSLLGLVLPATGELNNTWGAVVNAQLTQLIEDAIAGSVSNDITLGDWTLTTTAAGAQNQARAAILIATGTPGATRNIFAPKQSKAYIVVNNTDKNLFIKGGPGSPTVGVLVPPTSSILAAWNSVAGDFVKIAGGGGGATGGGTNQAFYENDQVISESYTIPNTKNAGTFGPITVDSGVVVTVSDGAVWTIV